MTHDQTARVLPTESLRTYACADCGRLVFPDDVPDAVLWRYVRTGARPRRCDTCRPKVKAHD